MSKPWHATVITLFPELFPGPLGASLCGKALAEKRWSLETTNPRSYTTDRHQSVDDTPFGGGVGMIMRPDVLARTVDSCCGENDPRPRICLAPRGAPFTQKKAEQLAEGPGAILLCGRYEGVDQRLIDARGFDEVSLGDYVLAGGEVAAMTVLEACTRLLPGTVGSKESLIEESFSSGLLEYPQYTRPRLWEGRSVPDVLLTGNHARIREWRRQAALETTRQRRPDLLEPVREVFEEFHDLGNEQM